MEKIKEKICVGLRETLRAADEQMLGKIILANDVDSVFKGKIKQAAEKHNIPLETISSSAELGVKAGIEVKAGVVGVFKSLI